MYFLGNSLSLYSQSLTQGRLFFGSEASKTNYNVIFLWKENAGYEGRTRLL